MFDKVDAELDQNVAQHVAVVGYSHGGGLVNDFITALEESRALGAQWSLALAGTVDAIQRGPIDNWLPAFAEVAPPSALRHVNYYNVAPWSLFHNIFKGAAIPGAAVNTPINATHGAIQISVQVQAGLLDEIKDEVWA